MRLTADGYRVWIDRFKLLGGEPYPRDVDLAIKERTFRLLALLSRSSLHKPNPMKERTLALNLAKARGEDFVIPINVDGLAASELDWMTSDLTFIPFHRSWAEGLKQLLKKLDQLETPRDASGGRSAVVGALMQDDVVTESAETLYTNLFRFTSVPEIVRRYRLSRPLTGLEKTTLLETCAFYEVDPQRLLAFHLPPAGLPADVIVAPEGAVCWCDVRAIGDIPAWQVIKPILRKSLLGLGKARGLKASADDPNTLYFPQGLVPKDRVRIVDHRGARTRVQTVGERKFGTTRFRYHLAATFDVLRDAGAPLAAKMRVRLHLTDLSGVPLPAALAVPRRKQIGRTWWNREWLNRHLAVASFLAKGQPTITVEGSSVIALESRPITVEANVGIDEALLPKGAPVFRWRPDNEREPEEGVSDE